MRHRSSIAGALPAGLHHEGACRLVVESKPPTPGRYTATPSAPAVLSPNNRFTGFHCVGDESAYSLSRNLSIAIADMGIAQRHGGIGMSQHSCDRRKCYSTCHSLTRDRMPEIVKTHVSDFSLPPRPVPQFEGFRNRSCGIATRREDVSAAGTRLAVEDSSRSLAQPDLPRSGLGLRQPEHVAVDLRPPQRKDLAPATSSQKQQADDVGSRLSERFFVDKPVQDAMKPLDFFSRKKPGQLGAGICPDALGRIIGDVAGRNRGIHDLPQQRERLVGTARRSLAVGVEPALDLDAPNPVKPETTESGQELSQCTVVIGTG